MDFFLKNSGKLCPFSFQFVVLKFSAVYCAYILDLKEMCKRKKDPLWMFIMSKEKKKLCLYYIRICLVTILTLIPLGYQFALFFSP